MYTVTVHHHDKYWRNGDLEDKFELIDSRNFKTRTDAKAWIESELKQHERHDSRGINSTQRSWHKGDKPSYCYYFTGIKWQHENSGEEMKEYYQYTLRKSKLK